MNYDELMHELKKIFPFENYIKEFSAGDPYKTVYSIANQYLPKQSNVLDFGSGPCDKTAIIALLGHSCVAYDDMQDQWHKESDNGSKILDFSKKIGIKYINTLENEISSQDNSFDMIMLNDVIEHLHESPKDILLSLIDPIGTNIFIFNFTDRIYLSESSKGKKASEIKYKGFFKLTSCNSLSLFIVLWRASILDVCPPH